MIFNICLLYRISLAYYIDGIVLIRQRKQEIATALNLLVTYICVRA